MKTTVIAPSNIALVKYWGRRNDELVLPYNGSISMTLDKIFTRTTVEFSRYYKGDMIVINGKVAKGDSLNRALNFIDLIRKFSGIDIPVKMVSENNFPTAAGLASSASGFAALAFACSRALGLNLNFRQLSILARRSGSGSAARSVLGGFVEWYKGKRKDGLDSYADQIVDENYWKEFRVVAAVLSKSEKKISSATGMMYSVNTSPFYRSWVESSEDDLKKIRKSIIEKDFETLGERAEHNCLKLHSVMLSTIPSLIYWESETLDIIRDVKEWRSEGLRCYFTIDAGPNVMVMCLKKDVKEVEKRLKEKESVKNIIVTKPGRGAYLSDKHLF